MRRAQTATGTRRRELLWRSRPETLTAGDFGPSGSGLMDTSYGPFINYHKYACVAARCGTPRRQPAASFRGSEPPCRAPISSLLWGHSWRSSLAGLCPARKFRRGKCSVLRGRPFTGPSSGCGGSRTSPPTDPATHAAPRDHRGERGGRAAGQHRPLARPGRGRCRSGRQPGHGRECRRQRPSNGSGPSPPPDPLGLGAPGGLKPTRKTFKPNR